MKHIKLIVGLCNPGDQYQDTRHNAGAWLIDHLVGLGRETLLTNKKVFGQLTTVNLFGHKLFLLKPLTYMNDSGRSVAAVAQFYKLEPPEILVVHDELSLAPGLARFKQGGGHGGHNGLKSIIASLGNQKDFLRLRLGIGHPGHKDDVVNFVLNKPSRQERACINHALADVMSAIEMGFQKDILHAMNYLHACKVDSPDDESN
ncbi:MAG: aminoacyl-tRNA hydrolase [Shewanellaceae bacterium]|nr:aminoacyl-tRNA hydrolase [Shewanellaceae bacterium]